MYILVIYYQHERFRVCERRTMKLSTINMNDSEPVNVGQWSYLLSTWTIQSLWT